MRINRLHRSSERVQQLLFGKGGEFDPESLNLVLATDADAFKTRLFISKYMCSELFEAEDLPERLIPLLREAVTEMLRWVDTWEAEFRKAWQEAPIVSS